MKKKICIVLCLGCIGTVSVVGCSNKNFDSKVTGDNLILSGTIILLLSISISLFPILCTKPKKILAEMEG